MRESVRKFIKLGPLPSNKESPDVIERHELALQTIQEPVTLEEANALADMFGPDDCFGLSWTLVHLIESAPGWESLGVIPPGSQPGLQSLRTRIRNAKTMQG